MQDARVFLIRAVDKYRDGSPLPLSRFVEGEVNRDVRDLVARAEKERAALEHAFALAEAA